MNTTNWLVAAALLGLFIATPQVVQAEPQPGPLRAGAAVGNVTPALGTSINGYFHDRKAAHVHDHLHARALVLDNGKMRVAVAVADSCIIEREVIDKAKSLAEARTGIPATSMLVCATHTHSGGSAATVLQSDADPAYQEFLAVRIADTIACAANNLEPARLAWGSGELAGHLNNRRWYMQPGIIGPNPFGQNTDKVLMNPPRGHEGLIQPAGPVDPQVPVLSVQSQQARPLAVLANYALHYVGGTGSNEISADYFGVFADCMQRALGSDGLHPRFVGMLTNGASGDVNNINFRAAGEPQKPYEQINIVAQDLAAEVEQVVKSLSYSEQVVLDVRNEEVTVGVRRPNNEELQAARDRLAKCDPCQLRAREDIYANETVKLAEYPPSVQVPLQVIRVGDAAIVAMPCEVFAEIGLGIKKKSPFKPTTIVELANGYNGYLPTPAQHELGGYETWRARSSYLEPQASIKIVARLLAMLDSLK